MQVTTTALMMNPNKPFTQCIPAKAFSFVWTVQGFILIVITFVFTYFLFPTEVNIHGTDN